MRERDEYDDANAELMHRLEQDDEREPHRPFVARPPRRGQFRYWSGFMFRPARSPAQCAAP